ncbi:MAG: hypothetical protein LBP71_02885 [Spirochaetaceae bacterium]|jgi:hypothetical protein|nr:hypothetical protein [Spirochaetaceae bacterium]
MNIYVPVIIGQVSRLQKPVGAALGSGETGRGSGVLPPMLSSRDLAGKSGGFTPFSRAFPKARGGPGKAPKAAVSAFDMVKPARFLIFFILMPMVLSCSPRPEDIALIPPPTPPLSRHFLGYGVVNVSYIQVLKEPVPGSESLGYLRRSSLVRVLERKQINYRGSFASWVLVEGSYRGWIREDTVRIYGNEAQARTAAESMPL